MQARPVWTAALVLLLTSLGGCEKELAKPAVAPRSAAAPAPAVDQSTPQRAAVSFSTAFEAGDEAGLRACSVGTPEDIEAVIAYAGETAGGIRLYKAIRSRFGEDAVKDLQYLIPDLVKGYQTVKVEVDGNTAKVVRERFPTEPPLILKESGGRWAVDLSRVAGRDQIVKSASGLKRMAKMYGELSQEVEAGKFASDAAAKAALHERREAITSSS